jgi:uncharacterized protein with von Willebrand factor type A (vWA) domain
MKPTTPLYDRIANPDLCYRTGAWDRYQWNTVAAELPDAAEVLARGRSRSEDFGAFPRETFARLYSEAGKIAEPGKGAEWATKLHDAMDALPEWQRLRDTVRGDAFLSGVAATEMAAHMLGELPEPTDKPAPSYAKARAAARAAARMGCGQEEAQEGLVRAENAASEMEVDEQAARIALRAATDKAAKAVDEAAKAQAVFGLGAGSGAGVDGKGSTLAEKQRLRGAMASSEKLRRIAELAGKMRAIAAQKRASRIRPQREEIVDVVCGDDLDRALPGQLALLATEAGRAEFARLLCGGELQCYEYDAAEPKGRGPMVLCVDNSGSMRGFPEVWSKALAFGLAEVAAKDKRDVVMVHFDGTVKRTARWTRGEIDSATALDMLEFFSGGGTEFEPPLREALRQITGGDKALDGADVVFVTDGYGNTSAAFEAEWQAARRDRKITAYGILIGYAHEDETMRRLFDKTWAVDERKLDGLEDGLLEEIAAKAA